MNKANIIGGKAASLLRLQSLGFQVPRFVVLSSAQAVSISDEALMIKLKPIFEPTYQGLCF